MKAFPSEGHALTPLIFNVVRLVNDDGSSMDFAAMQAYTVQLIEELHEGGAMELSTTVIRNPLG
jgi:hypothetical protein